MKALMFGWEFPPHILGGLGTASYGLTRGMSEQPDMEITFVIPKPHGDEDQSFLKIIGACNVPVVWKENSWEHVNNRIGKIMHPDEYFWLRNGIKYDFRFGGSLFFNPYGKIHSLVPFGGWKHHDRILESGWKFGFTYKL